MEIIYRSALTYLFVVIALRVMGRKAIAEMSGPDLAIVLMLPEAASVAMQEHGLWHTLGVIVALGSTYLLVDYLTVKTSLSKLTIPEPLLLIDRGELHYRNVAKAKMTLGELLAALRSKGHMYLDEVQWAILEEDGKISVFPKAPYQAVQAQDLQLQVQERGVPDTLILDRRVQHATLARVGIEVAELTQQIEEQGIGIGDVALAYLDNDRQVHLWGTGGKYTTFKARGAAGANGDQPGAIGSIT